MFGTRRFKYLRRASAIVIVALTAISAVAGAGQIFLGPLNPGAESGFDHWMYGVLGTGSVAVDSDDPAHGQHDFIIGITNGPDGQINHADFRNEPFPLPYTGKKRGPLTFSFAYKLPGPVKPGDNVQVYLRFFAEGDEVFLGQQVYKVGSSTGDSDMNQYRTLTITNIYFPRKTVKADIWVVANVIKPWTSGYAHFDDFSLTGPPARNWTEILFWGGTAVGVIILVVTVRYLRRRRST